MLLQAVQQLYPEHLSTPIDLERHAASVIVRAMNVGPDTIRAQILDYYGEDRVADVLRTRVDRLDTPVYDAWQSRLDLPPRSTGATALHRLWRS
jgi:hypothetical protein